MVPSWIPFRLERAPRASVKKSDKVCHINWTLCWPRVASRLCSNVWGGPNQTESYHVACSSWFQHVSIGWSELIDICSERLRPRITISIMFARVERSVLPCFNLVSYCKCREGSSIYCGTPLMENLPDSNQDDPQLMIWKKWLKGTFRVNPKFLTINCWMMLNVFYNMFPFCRWYHGVDVSRKWLGQSLTINREIVAKLGPFPVQQL